MARSAQPRFTTRLTGGLAVPPIAKVGAVAIAIGLVLDLLEHTVVPHLHDAMVAGFPVGEHVAHLVVLIGMVLVLAGIVADGVRTAGRLGRQEGSPRDAVR
jgi:hypothetical protein